MVGYIYIHICIVVQCTQVDNLYGEIFKQQQNEKWQSFKILELLDGTFLLQVPNVSILSKGWLRNYTLPQTPTCMYVCMC